MAEAGEGQNGMKIRWIGIPVLALAAIGSSALAQDVGPFGPPLGVKAPVVRSFTMTTTGVVSTEIKGGKGDEKTGLIGGCKPTMFANFGILHGTSFEQSEITIVSRDPIPTGMTGDIKLDRIWVRFYDPNNDERKFGGKGTMKLTTHEATPGKRRMIGSITGTKLEGFDKLAGKFIDVTAAFDMDFSCGVK
jgi:hypothetical protein